MGAILVFRAVARKKILVPKFGKPVLVLGATGGRRVVSSLCNVLAHRIGKDVPLDEAVRAPRIHSVAALFESLGYLAAKQDVASLHGVEFGSDLSAAQIAAQ